MPEKERRARAERALCDVGLAGREGRTSAQLSGGQQQRVAIARALVSEPLLLLADEPTGNLDSANSDEVMSLLQTIHAARGVTILLVTHQAEVGARASRIVSFRDGRVTGGEESAAR